MEFTPINTQEEFEARVKEVYGDVAGLQNQVTTLTGERDTAQSQLKDFQRRDMQLRIAREKGIPLEMATRLTGEDETAMKADAAALAASLRSFKGPGPMFDPEPKPESNTNANLSAMLSELRGE